MIDALRTIIFVHGVQWEPDRDLSGYSIPLQRAIERQAPSTQFRFREVLWSDVVEQKEHEIYNAGSLIDLLGGGLPSLGDVVQKLLEHIFKRQGIQYNNDKDTTLNNRVADLVKGSGQDFKEKAFSAIMDVILYESGIGSYQQEIRNKLNEALNEVGDQLAPIIYAHSLGSVISFDVLAARAETTKVPALGLITAGSPLGILRRDLAKFSKFAGALKGPIFWKNYYDADDFLAFWNPLKVFGYRDVVQDFAIDVSTIPFYSHTRYWSSDEIAKDLADLAATDQTPDEQ